MTAYEWLITYLGLSGSHRRGRVWQCPAHHDGSPSLSVSETLNGRVLIHCFGGCSVNDVMESLGLGLGALFEPRVTPAEKVLARQLHPPRYAPLSRSKSGSGKSRVRRRCESTEYHVYIPGRIRLERCRYSNGTKTCRWQVRDGADWRYAQGLLLSHLPLYRENELHTARAAGEAVVLCESESSVDALIAAGMSATTWAGGSANPPVDKLVNALKGAIVVWIPDNDPAGLRCSQVIETTLSPVCALHKIVPDAGDDARDLVTKSGGSVLRKQIMPLGQQLGNGVGQ